MIGQHESRHTMCTLNVRRLAWEGHLDTCWSPWNKLSQFAFTNSLQRLVNLCGVNFSLWQGKAVLLYGSHPQVGSMVYRDSKHQPPDIYKLYWGYTLQYHGYINSSSPLTYHTSLSGTFPCIPVHSSTHFVNSIDGSTNFHQPQADLTRKVCRRTQKKAKRNEPQVLLPTLYMGKTLICSVFFFFFYGTSSCFQVTASLFLAFWDNSVLRGEDDILNTVAYTLTSPRIQCLWIPTISYPDFA